MSVSFGRFLSKNWPQKIQLAEHEYVPQLIIDTFSKLITEERLQKLSQVATQRSQSFVVVLESIYDRGNISAVMRSAEAFGFIDVHIIEGCDKFKESARVTQGADKWLNIYKWKNTSEALGFLKKQGVKIYATHLSQDALEVKDLNPLPVSPIALVFGNEKDGVSAEALSLCDGNVLIPMHGFTQSFNISVAAALCLQEAHKKASFVTPEVAQGLKANYILKSLDLDDRQIHKILQSKI